MSGPASRLSKLVSHISSSNVERHEDNVHVHQLSPTFFLPRAAEIEPDAEAIYHITANGKVLRRSYLEFADRARGLAYYLRSHSFKRVGILCPNTPAFLESIFGIAAAGAVNVGVNYRLKHEDIAYIFSHAEVDVIIVDREFLALLDTFRKSNPNIPLLVDDDTDATEGQLSGQFDDVVLEGLKLDNKQGGKGWKGLEAQCVDEYAMLALAYTSGTTAKPKGVVYTHRGAYLAALANVIESGLNFHVGRCGYLWTLPMFHAMGWTFPWAVTSVRGTHFCLRKIDYPLIWRLLKTNNISHFNAAPTVNTLLCAASEAERLTRPVRVTVAASPPTAHLFETMEALNLMPVHVYGLTETYGPITKGYHMPFWDQLERKDKYARAARQGHGFITSLPVRVVRLEEAEGVLLDVRKDGKEIGEIIFFGNICAKEYYKDAEATRKLFVGGGLHSGDLAVWHADGAIQILVVLHTDNKRICEVSRDSISNTLLTPMVGIDRAKDIIISGGENISSVALESMLVQHPDVLEAGVVSVPDSHWGERPKAYITVREGKHLESTALIDWAKHQSSISKFMIPREVEIVDELPKTSTGKVKKNVLRAWAKGGVRSLE